MDLKIICKKFNLKGEFVKAKKMTNGIINNTYNVIFNENGVNYEYIIQKINKYVFKKPELVMQNILSISQHLISNMAKNNIEIDRNVLQYMVTKNNLSYYIDEEGEYWRCYKYINNSITYDNPENLQIIEQAGSAFAQFQFLLSDFDASSLHESIPNFHNTELRFFDLFTSADLDVSLRKDSAINELDYLKSREEIACSLCKLIAENKLPIKVTHNDTKCNNVLFDKDTNQALAVIDLDTVMPGLVAYDYGDAIRCLAATCAEDEKDLSKVDINLEKFEAFTKGFVSKVGKSLTKNEIESLPVGIIVITLELASRFLKDYLDGDIYFKIKYEDHNLVRAKCQIELAKKFEQNFDKMKQIINKYI